jgi:hypothetical protein
MLQISRRGLLFSGAAIALVGTAGAAQASAGSVYLDLVSAGFIFGASGGEGTLTYGGRRYRLSMGGLSAGLTFGASGAKLIGTAYHLRRASDIQGVYTKLGAGAATPMGGDYQDLQNANGVTLRLRGHETGLMVNFDLSGMALSLA